MLHQSKKSEKSVRTRREEYAGVWMKVNERKESFVEERNSGYVWNSAELALFFLNSRTLTVNQVEIAPTLNNTAGTGIRSAARTDRGQLGTRRVGQRRNNIFNTKRGEWFMPLRRKKEGRENEDRVKSETFNS